KRAGAIEVSRAAADSEGFRERHLHVVDVVAIPERLDDSIRETKDEQVLHGILAEEVIDAIDLLLAEVTVQLFVEPLRALEIVAERLLDHDAIAVRSAVQACLVELAYDQREVARRHGKVKG